LRCGDIVIEQENLRFYVPIMTCILLSLQMTAIVWLIRCFSRWRIIGLVPMPRVSAGLLMYRIHDGNLQLLLAHPGGPFFKNKDDGAWSIPKGEIEPGEDLLEAAKREFEEETGVTPTGPFTALRPVKQKGGKIVHAWAFEGDCDPSAIVSNTFTMEWPPKSGRQLGFPEIDRADFFDVAAARRKIKAGQEALIEELQRIVGVT
jgi:predicted NUDIX family NTP pyrophosphohydrolase